MDQRLAKQLKNEKGKRGGIVKVKGDLQLLSPPRRQGQRGFKSEEESKYNGIEETICTMRLKENIADPSRSDI